MDPTAFAEGLQTMILLRSRFDSNPSPLKQLFNSFALQRPAEIQVASIWESLNGLFTDDRPAAKPPSPPPDPAIAEDAHD